MDVLDEHHDEDSDGVCDDCGYEIGVVDISVAVEGADESAVQLSVTSIKLDEEATFTVTIPNNYRLVSIVDLVTFDELDITYNDGVYTCKHTFTEESIEDGKIGLYITVIKQVEVIYAIENATVEVTYTVADDQTIIVNSGDKVDVGITLDILVTPNDGYEVKEVTAGGATLELNNGKYQYPISADTTLNTIRVTASAELPSTEPVLVATFGLNGAGNPGDGQAISKNYTETNNTYTLTLTKFTQGYGTTEGFRLGSKNNTGSVTFTVADDITSIKIYVCQWDASNVIIDDNVNANGTTVTVSKTAAQASGGKYQAIEIDTSVTKTITISTNNSSADKRVRIDAIEYYK